MPKFKDGTVCRFNFHADPDTADEWYLEEDQVAEGAVTWVCEEDGQQVYIMDGAAYFFPEDTLVAVDPLASWEPIEYRSQPDANGDCDFIQWDGVVGGWVADGYSNAPRTFPTPEAAAEWVAKENANG